MFWYKLDLLLALGQFSLNLITDSLVQFWNNLINNYEMYGNILIELNQLIK